LCYYSSFFYFYSKIKEIKINIQLSFEQAVNNFVLLRLFPSVAFSWSNSVNDFNYVLSMRNDENLVYPAAPSRACQYFWHCPKVFKRLALVSQRPVIGLPAKRAELAFGSNSTPFHAAFTGQVPACET